MAERRFLTVAQVATICEVHPSTVRTWLDRGHIEREPDGRIDAAAVLRYLDRRGDVGQHVRRDS